MCRGPFAVSMYHTGRRIAPCRQAPARKAKHVEGTVTEPDSWRNNLDPKIADQVAYIRESFGNPRNFARRRPVGIGVETTPQGVAYMYAENEILVQAAYADRVRGILERLEASGQFGGGHGEEGQGTGQPGQEGGESGLGGGEPGAGERRPVVRESRRVISDVVHITLDERLPPVPRLLEIIDGEVGAGIATPNHLVTVAGDAGPCPATEPQEVDDTIEPYPSVCPGDAGAGVLIYVADTGLLDEAKTAAWRERHPWLRHGVRGEPDPDPDKVQPAEGTIAPYMGHGTFVAGVIRCMAPGAEIFVGNAFDVAGSTLETDLAEKLGRALDQGVDLFHLSITAPTRNDLPMSAFGGFLRRLQQYKGVACVVAAGNSGLRLPTWPAALPGMVSVGALAGDWRSRATFSNYGPWVDVYAPGRDIVNAFATGSYTCYTAPYKNQVREFYGMCKWSGTSFSTPIVTGMIAARMWRTGENAQEAAAALLAEARAQAIPGLGAILLPHCGPEGPCRPAERPGQCRPACC
jgi:Subtilase family